MKCRTYSGTDDIVTSCVRSQVPHFYILKFFALPLWCPVLVAFFSLFFVQKLRALVCGLVLSSLLLLFICHLFFLRCFCDAYCYLWSFFLLSISASRKYSMCSHFLHLLFLVLLLLIFFAFVICLALLSIGKVNKTPKTVRGREFSYRKWNAPHSTMGNKITSYIFEKRDRFTLFLLFRGGWRIWFVSFQDTNRTIEVGNFYICHVQ